MKKHSFSERFRYRLDGMMARGNVSMVKMLVIATLAVILLLTLAIHLTTPAAERDFGGSFWDALASAVNAWMPYSEDGSGGYILLTALAAVTGLLFTSILIGIVTGAVEEKVTGLKDGNSHVLEEGHIVVLGFVPGEYTLLNQMVEAAQGKKTCIVVAGDLPRSEMEALIRDNVATLKNVKIICRTAEAGDLSSLAVCSIETCKTVVVNQPSDVATLQSALAAHQFLQENEQPDVRIIANVSSPALLLPPHIAGARHLINISVNDVIARVIAHSCAETGLAKVYADLFDIRGGRLQMLSFPEKAGTDFGALVRTMRGAVPIGLIVGGKVLLNPPAGQMLTEADGVVCWTEEEKPVSFAEDRFAEVGEWTGDIRQQEEHTVVIGCNPAFETLLRELPEQPNRITAAHVPDDRRAALNAQATKRGDVSLSYFDGSTEQEEDLTRLLADAHHVVLLADETENPDEADILSLLRYIKISDIKRRGGLQVSITVELRSEKNLQLAEVVEEADLIVAPHIVSMFLAQLAERPQLVGVFKELLSNEGSEIHLKPADGATEGLYADWGELRAAMQQRGMILLGYAAAGKTVLNPDPEAPLSGMEIDKLVVISET